MGWRWLVQPSPEDFAEWLQHPTTEWIVSCMQKFADQQKAMWADLAWNGDLSEIMLTEAKTRADCYLAVPNSHYEDWKAIDDSEA